MPVTMKPLAASRLLLPALFLGFMPVIAQAGYNNTPDVFIQPYSPTPGGSADVMIMPGTVESNPAPRGLAWPINRPKPLTLGNMIEAIDNPPPEKPGAAPVEQPAAPPDPKRAPGAVQNLPARVDPREVPPFAPPPGGGIIPQPGMGDVVTQPAPVDPAGVPGVVPGEPAGNVPPLPRPGMGDVVTQPAPANPAHVPGAAVGAPIGTPPPLPKLAPQDLLPVPKNRPGLQE